MRPKLVAVLVVLLGGVGCGEPEPEIVDVSYRALNEEEQCVEVVQVQRPAEYWVYGPDQGCMDYSLPFVDPEGRCVFSGDDCGPELTFNGDPYFSTCDTLPGCCDQYFEDPRCE